MRRKSMAERARRARGWRDDERWAPYERYFDDVIDYFTIIVDGSSYWCHWARDVESCDIILRELTLLRRGAIIITERRHYADIVIDATDIDTILSMPWRLLFARCFMPSLPDYDDATMRAADYRKMMAREFTMHTLCWYYYVYFRYELLALRLRLL